MPIKVQIMTIPGAPVEGVNPLPMFHHKGEIDFSAAPVFPAKRASTPETVPPFCLIRCRTAIPESASLCAKKVIVLKNEFLRATFWPEDGGRLYSLFDKEHDAELLMSSPVYRPGNLAIRNAWLSGGIEWNLGSYAHHARTCDHIYAFILKRTKTAAIFAHV